MGKAGLKTYGIRIISGIAAIIILMLMVPPASGQNEPGGLYVSGKITTEQGSVDGSIIKMTRNGSTLPDYNVLPDGKFNLRFEFNNDYTLIFRRKDNFPQKIVINTQVPSDVLRRDRKFPPFPVDINLFTEVKGVESTFAENAVLRIYYSASVDNFISDVYYNNQQLKKLIDQAILQSQSVKRESDLLKKLSAAELAEMKKDYGELLTKAGREFEKQEYLIALEDYQSASRIFPEEQFPRDRIAEIRDLIAILGLQADLDSMLARKARAEAMAKAITEAQAKAKAKAEAEAKAMTKAQAEAQAKAEAEAKATAKMEAEAKTRAEAEAKMLAKIQAEAEKARLSALQKARQDSIRLAQEAERQRKAEELAEQVARAKAEAEAKAEAKAQAEAQAKAEAEAERTRLASEAKMREEAANNQIQVKYQSLIDEADKLAGEQQLVEAVGKFRAALEVKPRETYPIKRIEEIRGIISKQQAEKKAYDDAIVRGDAEFSKKQYLSARASFEQARSIKSSEKYPVMMIARIDSVEAAAAAQLAAAEARARAMTEAKALAEAKAEAEKMAKAMTEAKAKAEAEAEKVRLAAAQKARQDSVRVAQETEKLRKAQELAEAKAKAEAEAKAKAEAESVARAMEEAEKARLAAAQKARQDSIRLALEAEKLRKAQELAEAKAKAEAEAKAKAEAEAVARAMEEAEKARLAAAQKARQDSIRLALEAEQKRKAQELAEAKAKAEAEAKAKAEAEAVARAMAEAEKARLAAAQKARQDSIRLALEAEQKRKAQELAEAKAKAEAEQVAKAIAEAKAKAEAEAKVRAEAELARMARQQILSKENEELYNSLIASGDQSFNNKEYNVSRAWYYKALEILPEEKYPAGRLVEINNILHSRQLSETELEFQQYIDKGDDAFRINQWAVARAWYNRALGIKPNDPYSKSQLTEILIKINESISGNTLQTFNGYMEQGNKAFEQKQYNVAKVWFLRAKELKPTDAAVNSKLEEIRKAISSQ